MATDQRTAKDILLEHMLRGNELNIQLVTEVAAHECEWGEPTRFGTEICGEDKDFDADDRLPYCSMHRAIALSEDD